jgi:hypothetical protein
LVLQPVQLEASGESVVTSLSPRHWVALIML